MGVTDLPFLYKVTVVRDGRNYCQRRVDVTQEEEGGVMFTAVCSFKVAEENAVERTLKSRVEEEYRVVLDGVPLESLPECPGIDSPL